MTLKTKLIFGGLGLIIVASMFLNWQLNRMWRGEQKRVEYYQNLSTQNEYQKDSISARHDSIQVVLVRYQYIVDSLETVVEGNYSQIGYLSIELEKALEEIKDAPYDDNYIYLMETFPPKDTLIFPFAGNQVKRLTQEVITRQYTEELYSQQIDISLIQQKQLDYKSEIIKTLKRENVDMDLLVEELYDRLDAKLNECQMKDVEIERLTHALKLWRVGALSGGAFIILALLLI